MNATGQQAFNIISTLNIIHRLLFLTILFLLLIINFYSASWLNATSVTFQSLKPLQFLGPVYWTPLKTLVDSKYEYASHTVLFWAVTKVKGLTMSVSDKRFA